MNDFPDDPAAHGITDELVHQMSAPIGLMTISWGFIEHVMSAIIEVTDFDVTKAGLKVVRATRYDEKRKYISLIFNKVDALAKYKDRANKILKDMKMLTEIRHLLTHGTITEFDSATGIFIFTKVNPAPDLPFHYYQNIPIRISTIMESGTYAQMMVTRWEDLGNEIALDIMAEEAKDG